MNLAVDLGALQSVTFAGKLNGGDVYDVRFAGASSTWGVMLAPDGKINHMFWRFQ